MYKIEIKVVYYLLYPNIAKHYRNSINVTHHSIFLTSNKGSTISKRFLNLELLLAMSKAVSPLTLFNSGLM